MSITIQEAVSTKMRMGLAAFATACGIALSGTPALADVTAEPLSKVVNYADLDLNHPPGVKVLYERLRSAAQGVCQPFEGRTLKQVGDSRACFDQAMARAVKDVNKPLLTAYYHVKTGKGDTQVAIATK